MIVTLSSVPCAFWRSPAILLDMDTILLASLDVFSRKALIRSCVDPAVALRFFKAIFAHSSSLGQCSGMPVLFFSFHIQAMFTHSPSYFLFVFFYSGHVHKLRITWPMQWHPYITIFYFSDSGHIDTPHHLANAVAALYLFNSMYMCITYTYVCMHACT